jgi:hypothetical protein
MTDVDHDYGLLWEDVEDAAGCIFNVWQDGGELAWARECWQHFRDAGLTSNDTLLEETKSRLRLLALVRVYQDFCELAWDLYSEPPIDDQADALEIDPVALGILAAKVDVSIEYDTNSDYDLREQALIVVTDELRHEIFRCLRKAYGDVTILYARIYKTIYSPEEAEELMEGDIVEEWDVTPQTVRAFQFVAAGFNQG